ncbi:MAG: S-layer homology domain-containing protein, partial [Lachnospiraceae bacterium]|nr:S-layer homology domain-containing protein [Lachnospiraceae bacterium]
LISVTIPDSVTSIGSSAFSGCRRLSSVFYSSDQSSWDLIIIESDNEKLEKAAIHYNGDGHRYVTDAAVEATCTENGLTEGKHCETGGEILLAQEEIAAFGHTWGEWEVTEEATYEASGTRTRICETCKETETEEIPQLELPFTDVSPTSPFLDAILWAKEQGITGGITPTTFGPDQSCTRGQAVTFMYRAAEKPEGAGDVQFTDVSTNSFCYKAVCWAVEKGITYGTSAAAFSPDATCTRGQIVTFLYRNR